MATNGDLRARQIYEFVYGDAADGWEGIVALHEKAIQKRIGEIEEERRNDKKSGAKHDAPAGVVAVAPPERYAFKLERGRSDVAENILSALKDLSAESEGRVSRSEMATAVRDERGRNRRSRRTEKSTSTDYGISATAPENEPDYTDDTQQPASAESEI